MILLLGHTGYVGSAFSREFQRRDITFRGISRRDSDYTRLDPLIDLIRDSKADFLVNAAGYTGKPNVDACEIHKSECLHGNAVLPGTIREACEAIGTPWGHVSSGCIYTGRREDGLGFTENDTPNFCFRTDNCSWYSGCKALGEEILADSESTYVWRLRIPFNREDTARNYLSKILRYDRLLQAENSIAHLDEFVSACLDCWIKRVPFGTYNVTNTGSVTTKRITELIQKHLSPEKQFNFFADEAEFMQIAAKTPRSNCVMDNSKLLATGIPMRNVEDAIVRSLQGWRTEKREARSEKREDVV
ncbi:sugar nucleotide-binding protein [Aporhodopirellula aestuarii]|uniref:dTDP-4-dehydrorhamnose reductase n=1 Tax=Aporhodopirellula aestuarii TaxID=2950107 RepID=A0ABT0UAF8_9BACT|nr:sugar nucleotide-binding protein [Aporhodopirellula aestuarii]MCM2373984.1 sugar nucleotide-binding protein [Aporhodopirellula aestuarii]